MGECVESFTVAENLSGSGGSQVSDVTGVEACEEYCRNQPPTDCFEFDFDLADESCWIFPESFDAATLTARNNVNHHTRNQDCIGTYLFTYLVYLSHLITYLIHIGSRNTLHFTS